MAAFELYGDDVGRVAHCFGLGLVAQALLQMQDIPSALGVMQYYTSVQPSVR